MCLYSSEIFPEPYHFAGLPGGALVGQVKHPMPASPALQYQFRYQFTRAHAIT